MTRAQKTKAWLGEGKQIEAQGLGFLPKRWEYFNTSCGRMQEATVTCVLALAAIYTESISNGGGKYVSSEGSLVFLGQALCRDCPAGQFDSWKAQKSYSEVRTWQMKKLRRSREAKGPPRWKDRRSKSRVGQAQVSSTVPCPAVVQKKLNK